MRVGVISPNVVLNLSDVNAMSEDSSLPWPFESLAKRASLLFDKIYLTDDLNETCTILESVSGDFENDSQSATLEYLNARGLIATPQDFGFDSGRDFLSANLRGAAAQIHDELLRIGNPGIDDDTEYGLVGQPDVGWLAAHDGWHPRRDKNIRGSIRDQERAYESLLLRRNAELLRQAGASDAVVVGRLFEESGASESGSPVWKVVIGEMPQLDTNASWEDVLGFRAEERTQHLIRSLRRWVRKVVSEDWSEGDLQDEVRELIYEYETHLRAARLGGNSGIFEVLVTGAAEIAEDLVKLRFGKLGQLAMAVRNRRVKLLAEEAKAPGRELALIPEMKRNF